MEATTAGRYRVVSAPDPDRVGPAAADGTDATDDGRGFVLVTLEGTGPTGAAEDRSGDGNPDGSDAYDPVRVAADGYEGDLAADVTALEPGYVVDATVEWADGVARFASVDVESRTRYLFADGVTDLFEAARDAWQEARAAGESMASRVTRDTDGEPNGALYVFADGGGGGGGTRSPVRRAATAGTGAGGGEDLFAAFRDGTVPLDPLVERVNEDAPDGPREVFVLRPADGAFVVVYIAFEKGGLLARTVRDTYL